MKRLVFTQKSAQRIYDHYLDRVKRSTAVLSASDQQELLMEINSHFYEAFSHTTGAGEIETLLDIVERLGPPEEFLKPLLADRKLAQAATSFHPIHMVQAFLLNLHRTGILLLMALFGLFFVGILLTILGKIFLPDHTGVFIENGRLLSLGTTQAVQGQEVVGNWYIPLALVSLVLLYLILVLLLRLLRRK